MRDDTLIGIIMHGNLHLNVYSYQLITTAEYDEIRSRFPVLDIWSNSLGMSLFSAQSNGKARRFPPVFAPGSDIQSSTLDP